MTGDFGSWQGKSVAGPRRGQSSAAKSAPKSRVAENRWQEQQSQASHYASSASRARTLQGKESDSYVLAKSAATRDAGFHCVADLSKSLQTA